MKLSLESVRGILSNQISGIPEHLDIVRCEDGTTAMFLLDAKCGNVARCLCDNAPGHYFDNDTRSMLLAAITCDKIGSVGG